MVDEYTGARLRDGNQSHYRMKVVNTVNVVSAVSAVSAVSVVTVVLGYKAAVRLSTVVKAAVFSGLTCHLGVQKRELFGWIDLMQ